MSRTVVTRRDVAAARRAGNDRRPGHEPPEPGLPLGEQPPPVPDPYTMRLMKYIPGEVVAFYLALEGIAKTAEKLLPLQATLWVAFGLGLAGTVLYLRRVAKVATWSQIAISALAYVAWVFAIGGPFEPIPWRAPAGAFAVVVFTFVVPMFTG